MSRRFDNPLPVRYERDELEREVAELRLEVIDLKQAVRSGRLIGAAVGFTMHRFDLTHEEAFGYLRRLSQSTNVKLVSVADQLLRASESAALEIRRNDREMVS